jgi:hypothetical protein
MASSRIRLDPQTVDAIARRVVDLLRQQERGAGDLVDATELARRLGVDRSWIYAHAIELGAVRLGKGPRPRLRFDLRLALARFRAGVATEGNSKPARPPRRRGSMPGFRGDRPRLLPIKSGGES